MWNLRENGNRIAFILESGEQVSYAELDYRQKHCAALIGQKRQLVFLLADNSLECITIYVSCIQHKIPLLILQSDISWSRLCDLVDFYQPEYMGVW